MGTRSGNRMPAAIALLSLLMGACTAADRVPSAGEARPSSPGTASERRRVGGVDIVEPEVNLEPSELPYAYQPAPPLEPTPADGTYLRILTFDDIGLPLPQSFPIRCLRCAPFYVHAGVSSLILDQGRYWLHHQLSGFESLGHYRVAGNRILLLNDPHCPDDIGTYRWDLSGYDMSFELVGGACVWEPARAHDLMRVTWTKIDPCVFRFENLWPARLGC